MKRCYFYNRTCNHCGNCSFSYEVNGQINHKRNHSAFKRAQKKKIKQANKENQQ